MQKTADFRQKEVINIKTGQRMGFISDVDVDMDKGTLNSVIIPGAGKVLGMFGRGEDVVIPWECIRTIGDEVILVDYDAFPTRRQAK